MLRVRSRRTHLSLRRAKNLSRAHKVRSDCAMCVGDWTDSQGFGEFQRLQARTGVAGGQVWKHFWATQQRFFKLLAVSMKVRCLKSLSTSVWIVCNVIDAVLAK